MVGDYVSCDLRSVVSMAHSKLERQNARFKFRKETRIQSHFALTGCCERRSKHKTLIKPLTLAQHSFHSKLLYQRESVVLVSQ
ncbi:hypothetical protein OJAV_G00035080 [Oryzias javanicus]|uniref:Uncharacterized protein n=1 Tax=Oryzias javanicus TaxID=123683 RepID=A0A3S2PHH0_ORYJA|nr:hypothetical protein OJAV_G00035080 [Oryzias javanicus]